jgi:hypothetical protein
MTETNDERLPILVGLVGKRVFDAADAANNARLFAAFETRFRALVAFLDAQFPGTPKVLMCGGAAGTDLCAAGIVLEPDGTGDAHPLWSVAVVLPMPRALFEQDFAGPPHRHDADALVRLLSDHRRVTVKELRPLLAAPFDDRLLEPPDLPRVSLDRLQRGTAAFDADERRAHYEQLALWMARQSTVFVAAYLPEAGVPKPGGTARAVAFRRAAMPDEYARQVMARSSEVLRPSPFEDPDGGYVLWINPAEQSPPHATVRQQVRVLRPVQRLLDVRQPGASPAAARDRLYAVPTLADLQAAPEGQPSRNEAAAWKGAMALAGAFDRFNRAGDARARREPLLAPAAITSEHPVSYLARMRPSGGAIGLEQAASAGALRLAQRGCAVLFLLSITAYEAHTEFLEENCVPLLFYVGLLAAIWGWAELVRHNKVQARAEDYRGVQEMLRVQIAWWGAGIDRMVDRVHLRTIDTDLRLVREAAAMISTWALLRCAPAATLGIVDINAALGTPKFRGRLPYADWIDEQAKYFDKKSNLQRQITRLGELTFKVTLLAALLSIGAMAVALGVLSHGWLAASLQDAMRELPDVAPPCAAVLLPASLGWLLWVITGREGATGERRFGVRGLVAYTMVICSRIETTAALCLVLIPPVWIAVRTALLPAGGTLNPWLDTAVKLGNIAPAYLLAGVALAAILFTHGFRVGLDKEPANRLACAVRDLNWWQLLLSALLIAATLTALATCFAAAGTAPGDLTALAEQVRRAMLSGSILLLSAAGMNRWYSERRNHLAQAARYDDLLRAFRRAEDLLRQRPAAPEPDLRDCLGELGEMALDENEAWLKAHRERPLEAMGGA